MKLIIDDKFILGFCSTVNDKLEDDFDDLISTN